MYTINLSDTDGIYMEEHLTGEIIAYRYCLESGELSSEERRTVKQKLNSLYGLKKEIECGKV